MCCDNGVVDVQEENPSPLACYIFHLWETDEYEGRVFRKYARKINNAFSLASFGVDEELSDHYSTSTYKVRGKSYVRVGSLLPRETITPQFAQIYCYDAHDDKERVEVRLNHVHLDEGFSEQRRQTLFDLFSNIQEALDGCNPFVKQFKLAKEMDIADDMEIVFHPEIVPTGGHERAYNAPTHELCICSPNTKCGKFPPLILRQKPCAHDNGRDKIETLHDCHPLYDIIRYLLFFPDGGRGWTPKMKNKNGKPLTLRQYYKYLLHERPVSCNRLTGNMILQGQRLMMEFTVMAFLRSDTQKLRWAKDHQTKLRAELYSTLQKNVNQNNGMGVEHGRRVILPATHYGSVRWYRQKNLESLAIAREKGKPHLFITMTCNPNHPSILKCLTHGVKSEDRPDIVLRVFRQQRL